MVVACQDWLGHVYKDDEWHVSGDEVGNRFVLHFRARPSSAALQARKAHALLRPTTRGGAWKELAATTEDGTVAKLYVNQDQSPQQQRLAAAQGRVKEAISRVHPHLSGAMEAKGSAPRAEYTKDAPMQALIGFEAQDLVAIRADSRLGDPVLLFEPGLRDRLHLDIGAITRIAMGKIDARGARVVDVGVAFLLELVALRWCRGIQGRYSTPIWLQSRPNCIIYIVSS